MDTIEKVLESWEKDSVIDQTEPSKELIRIPTLHSKYLNVLTRSKLLSKKAHFDYLQMKKKKWEYYTGKMSREDLEEMGWEPFPFVLKSDINLYIESDNDLIGLLRKKIIHDEIVSVVESILSELKSRTFQLRDFISWEKFINGV
jgi:Recombination, repair and ssDNA binding protein UvsY